MKKFFLLLTGLIVNTLLFAQPFQVNVKLTGNCVTPDQNTYYAIRVDALQGNVIVATATSTTPSTNYSPTNGITVQLLSFCTADNTPVYKITVEAAKIYLSPPSIICNNKETFNGPWSCDDFFNNLIQVGPITLQ